jgi:hypothetical protein
MIIDADLVMSENQVVTTSDASTDYLDINKPGDAVGNELELKVICGEDAAADGAATVTIALQTAADSAFTSPKTLLSTGALALADMVKGAELISARIPKGALQYLRVYYTVATGPLTKGKFTAFLSFNQ